MPSPKEVGYNTRSKRKLGRVKTIGKMKKFVVHAADRRNSLYQDEGGPSLPELAIVQLSDKW